MPTYEYECKKCGKNFEADQRITDPPLTKCLECNGKVERLISRCSFVLKGDGWYVTDYPSKERKAAMEKKKKTTESPKPVAAKKDDNKAPTPATTSAGA